ncbi:MAG: hypothetical protein WAP51_03150 [Candidatus Sungiibacteriota bacterium]
MTGCCGGMGQSEEPRKPEGQCHGMGIPAKEVIGKVKEAIEKFRATLLCPVHNIQGVPALTGPEADEALLYNFPRPVSLGQLKIFFQEALLKCSARQCPWRCPLCRQWTVVPNTNLDGAAWRCPKCSLLIHICSY